jgi:hypothetical protein
MSKHSSSGQHYFEYGDFNFIPLLQQWALEEADKFMKGNEARPTNFTRLYWRDGFDHLVDKIDEELASKNLPDVLLIHLFKRPPLFVSAIHFNDNQLLISPLKGAMKVVSSTSLKCTHRREWDK